MHFTVMVAIREAKNALDAYALVGAALEPFGCEYETDARVEYADPQSAVDYYREFPDHCNGEDGPAKPFDEYVTEGNLEALVEWTRQAVGSYQAGDPEAGVYDAQDDTYGYRTTSNPNSQWDWWQLGGRWNGMLTVKPGVSVGALRRMFAPLGGAVDSTLSIPEPDENTQAILGSGSWGGDGDRSFDGKACLARKGDIDFETMTTMALHAADLCYDEMEEATAGIEPPPPYDEYCASLGLSGREAAVKYRESPWHIAVESKVGMFMGCPVAAFRVHTGGRAAYLEDARARVFSTHAMLLDGNWTTSDDTDNFDAQQRILVSGLPDDTWLAVVDCHM